MTLDHIDLVSSQECFSVSPDRDLYILVASQVASPFIETDDVAQKIILETVLT